LSDNTVRRRCGISRQFFNDAIERRLIAENPFAKMKGVAVRANKSRHYFVSREEAQAVLDACPDAQWRLLFALSRFGGLRCPSEHLALRWGDIDWERGRIVVRSPKTEHHEGKGERTIPLFPELRPYLEAVRDELLASDFDPKQTPMSKQPVITRYRDSNANLRTQLSKIIRRAGLKLWPKLFQNLRSTRETELAEEYPMHVVCDWIGNSQAVAAKHYLQTTDEHFAKAAQNAAHNTTQLVGMDGNALERNCEIAGENENSRMPIVFGVGDTGFEPVTSAV
jgi:integrase